MTTRLQRAWDAETELVVKRSRFIARLARVDSEEEARAVIADTRRRYPDARHHCTAFVVEVPDASPIARSSDDGEPAGTAGMPILATLLGADVTQAVAVVTRYFGGVLLGAGGLARAYSAATRSALDAAPRVRLVRRQAYELEVPHADGGRIETELRSAGVAIVDAVYGQRVTLRFLAPMSMDVPELVSRLTSGRGVLVSGGHRDSEPP